MELNAKRRTAARVADAPGNNARQEIIAFDAPILAVVGTCESDTPRIICASKADTLSSIYMIRARTELSRTYEGAEGGV